MNINLQQHEIQNALKQYVSQQGISMINKLIAFEFAHKRKTQEGLSVNIVITDAVGESTAAHTETVKTESPQEVVAAEDSMSTNIGNEATVGGEQPASIFN